MTASAVFMGIAGLVLMFIPDEILYHFGYNSSYLKTLPLQITGALYFSFAVLNYMARGSIIGGIYSKPVSLGNFAHFFIGALTIIKASFEYRDISAFWIAGAVYSLFAILFALVSFGNPLKPKKQE